jgi:hypothetical protein
LILQFAGITGLSDHLQLIRDFTRATLEVLKERGWEPGLVSRLVAILEEEVMDAGKESHPDGLRLHLAELYLEEVARVGAEEVSGACMNMP